MPKVNVHYTFTKDAYIDTIAYIRFQNKDACFWKDIAGNGIYKGVVESIYVDNNMNVDISVHGIEATQWTLDVTIKEVKLDDTGTYQEFGPTYKLENLPITKSVEANGISQYDEAHLITQ